MLIIIVCSFTELLIEITEKLTRTRRNSFFSADQQHHQG